MEPVVARLKPYLIELEAGRTYWWCTCGRSRSQPYCDGSHKGTPFTPRRHLATAAEEVLFCGCKHTRTPPFCDGTHANLPGGAPLDDPDSDANRSIPHVESSAGRALLDGGCYVCSPARVPHERRDALEWCPVITAEHGARYQSQYWLGLAPGARSPAVAFGERDVILFVAAGRGAVTISGRRFEVDATDGVYVRPHEAFALESSGDAALEAFVSAGPLGPLGFVDAMPSNFDTSVPERVVRVDRAQRTAMGPRWFQVLVDKRIGARLITQFIGHIPPSKAASHRHLYEEALIILSGAGCMWTEGRRAAVRAGDVIFLPRKQAHSLQSTSADGMDVVGVIFPGDNPGINY